MNTKNTLFIGLAFLTLTASVGCSGDDNSAAADTEVVRD